LASLQRADEHPEGRSIVELTEAGGAAQGGQGGQGADGERQFVPFSAADPDEWHGSSWTGGAQGPASAIRDWIGADLSPQIGTVGR